MNLHVAETVKRLNVEHRIDHSFFKSTEYIHSMFA